MAPVEGLDVCSMFFTSCLAIILELSQYFSISFELMFNICALTNNTFPQVNFHATLITFAQQ